MEQGSTTSSYLDCRKNLQTYLVKTEDLQQLIPTSFCHDIVAEISNVSVYTKVKKVMNIEIRDGQNSKWAMVAWGADAERLENQLVCGHVYHFDGFYVQSADKKSEFAFGKTLKFTLKSNSVVTDLTLLYQKDDEPKGIAQEPVFKIYKVIQECVDENFKNNTTIGLDVFIKSAFVPSNSDNPLRWGALTDGEVKITTCVMNYNDPNSSFEVGERITAYGKISEYKEKAVFEIVHVKHIRKNTNETKPLTDIRRIVKTPKKPMKFSEQSGQANKIVKKLKMDDDGKNILPNIATTANVNS